VATHFKKLTTGNNVFIVSAVIQSNYRILQFFCIKCSICPHCCWTKHSLYELLQKSICQRCITMLNQC